MFFLSFLSRNKINLNEISHDSASGLVNRVLNMGVLLTEVRLF
jgi:ribonuclease H2 subunit A